MHPNCPHRRCRPGEDDEMVDPFAHIEEEAGDINSSQDSLLDRSGFLGESDDALPAISSSSDGPSSPAADPAPTAEPPILLFSVPSSPSLSPDPRDLRLHSSQTPTIEHLSLNPEKEKSDLPSAPSVTQDTCDLGLPSSPATGNSSKKPKFKKSRKRARGAKIRSPESGEELDFNNYKPQPESLELLSRNLGCPSSVGATMGARKLPVWIENPLPEGGWSSNAPGGGASFPATLADVINMFSRKPNTRFQDTDIMEIAAMKGIVFPTPSWWRPEGYD